MILIVTTREHRYTHTSLWTESSPDVRVITYDQLFGRKHPVRATHIFTDLDRLPAWRLHEAALLYRELRGLGIKVLNDPALALSRFGLLRALKTAGINHFDVYRADGEVEPRCWPVFLRMEGSHGAPLTGLLQTSAELQAAIRDKIAEGFPRAAMLVIEYASEPVRPGLYRRLSVFRVGQTLLGYTSAHDDNWIVKYGKPGIASPDLYEEEYTFVSTHQFAEAMRPVFDLAGVEYGRVDFGLVNGVPQVYEINGNPHVVLGGPPSPVARRNESTALFRLNYLKAMQAIDMPNALASHPNLVSAAQDLGFIGALRARRAARTIYRAVRDLVPKALVG